LLIKQSRRHTIEARMTLKAENAPLNYFVEDTIDLRRPPRHRSFSNARAHFLTVRTHIQETAMLMVGFYHTSGPDQNPRFISRGAVQKCVRVNRPSYQNVSRETFWYDSRSVIMSLSNGEIRLARWIRELKALSANHRRNRR
jgi:hypothetical protein